MFKKISFKKICLAIIIILIICQFFRIDKTNPEFDKTQDFIAQTQAPEEIANILKNSCYDCHSNEVVFPWYTNVAPISWWIKNHVNEGRDELNFSLWGTFKSRRKDHKLDEAIELIQEGEMPMTSYTLIHRDANLSTSQKEKLIVWLNSIRTFESEKED